MITRFCSLRGSWSTRHVPLSFANQKELCKLYRVWRPKRKSAGRVRRWEHRRSDTENSDSEVSWSRMKQITQHHVKNTIDEFKGTNTHLRSALSATSPDLRRILQKENRWLHTTCAKSWDVLTHGLRLGFGFLTYDKQGLYNTLILDPAFADT